MSRFLFLAWLLLVAGVPAPALAQSVTPQSFTVSLNPGWNAVGFQCQRLVSLSVPPQVVGASYFDGSAYRTLAATLESLSQAEGLRRGFWLYANATATLTYSGVSDGPGPEIALRAGWNLINLPGLGEIAGANLRVTQNAQSVPLGSVLLARFFELGPNNLLANIDVQAGGTLRMGRSCWVYANAPAVLSWLAGPAPGGSPGGSPPHGPPPAASPVGSPVETWKFTSYLIGRVNGQDTEGSVLMPNVIRRPDGNYRMYYNLSQLGNDRIRYADSSDLEHWTVGGTALAGSSDPNDREFMLGGPCVVRLSDGRYRMYYRCATKQIEGKPPAYHLRSALSSDGATFTREGIRIDIQAYDPASPFALVGHGSVYELPNGGYGCVFSGNPVGDTGPSDLVLATSSDGLSWGNFKTLYPDWHDPTVVRHNGQYYLYAGYLHVTSGRAISTDGVTWPGRADAIDYVDAQGAALSIDNGIGDLGVISTAEGLRMFSNFSSRSGDQGPGGLASDIVGWRIK